ncbi:TPA: hypothetical protein HA238_06585 [Candidatus Micrarchaeota archaeon]|nr:hypothetical protein [Candidatus Micrarchaeota archaeon]
MEVLILTNEKGTLEFEMKDSDSSLGNLLASKLNDEKGVEFAGFKVEHPSENRCRVIVKTKKGDPVKLVGEKLSEIEEELEAFKKDFKAAVK